jgi:Ser/Thr protein kinase RdoA (MazF antagonist)
VSREIPLPPPDPALPGLQTALSGDAVAEILAQRLPDCATGRFQLESCRPQYIRYKPGTNCLVQYELGIRHQGELMSAPAHARLFADGHAEVIWSGRTIHRLVAEAHRLVEPRATRAVLLPELQAIVKVYPVDRKLRGLVQAASPTAIRDVVVAALPGEITSPNGLQVELVRYKAARKAVLRYRLREAEPAFVYGKVHADGRGASLLRAGRALATAGVETPWPRAYLADLNLLLLAEAPGRPLSDLRDLPPPAFDDWLAPVAAALGAVHRTGVEGVPHATPRNEAGTLLASSRHLVALRPEIADRVARLAENVAARLAEVETGDALCHGDFYDDQVLVGDAGVVLIDFDRARLGNALLDVGSFLAHLTACGAESSREPFLDAYPAARPEARRSALLFEAAALLRRAVEPFRRLDPDWPAELERLVELSAGRLEEYRRGPRRSSTEVDPGLPLLELVQDPAVVGRELERQLGTSPIEVTRATVVRHKPGRRCLLRYELVTGNGAPQPERLYGKTYASTRGPRIYAQLQVLAAARACGPDVAIPEPVAYVEPLRLLLQREVPGEPIRSRLLSGDKPLAACIAEALHELHGSSVELERRHDLHDELAPLAERVERLGAAGPSLADQARRCLELVRRGSRSRWPWRWRPIHRDLYHGQVLAGEHGISILDFDDAAMSEPAVDVANFLGHLRLLALEENEATEEVARVAAAFSARYRELDTDLDPALLRFLEGATLLRLAEIHLQRSGELLSDRLLTHSELLLR